MPVAVQPDKLAESFQYFLQGLGLGKSVFDNDDGRL